jgi:hypothetical protein
MTSYVTYDIVGGKNPDDIFRFFFFQALLLLGIFVNLEMLSTLPGSRAPAGSHFIGYQCTNKSCKQVFATHHELVRHKTRKAQKMTPCHPRRDQPLCRHGESSKSLFRWWKSIYLRMIRKIRIVSLSTQVRKFRVNPVEMRFLHLIYTQSSNYARKTPKRATSKTHVRKSCVNN